MDASLASEGPCDFGGSWQTEDFWMQNFTAHPKLSHGLMHELMDSLLD
jgi:hypothetical protein